MNKLIKIIVGLLIPIYSIVGIYTLINSGIIEIPLSFFLTTVTLIAIPIPVILFIGFFPPFWILLTWYLFKKN